jgi:hypothetical protein
MLSFFFRGHLCCFWSHDVPCVPNRKWCCGGRCTNWVLATVAFTDALSRSDAEISAILAKHRVEQTAVSGRLAIAVVSGKIGTLEKLQTALKLNGTANVIIEYPGLLRSVE